MMPAARCSLLVCALLAGVGACDSGEIVVFSAVRAGSGGENALAGLGGLAAAAGDGHAGAPTAAGSGGMSGGGGSGGDSVDIPCQSNVDCGPAWYCQKQSCASLSGVCVPNESEDEDPVAALVCDCEGITYWNDTLRKLRGVSASTSGACGAAAKPCMTDQTCGSDPGVRCVRNLRDFNDCANPGTGQCWVVPSTCSVSGDKADRLPCPPPGPISGPPPCLTLCLAINSHYPFFKRRADDLNCL